MGISILIAASLLPKNAKCETCLNFSEAMGYSQIIFGETCGRNAGCFMLLPFLKGQALSGYSPQLFVRKLWRALDEDGGGSIQRDEWESSLDKVGYFGPSGPIFSYWAEILFGIWT